eukprot:366079-Chlamydomonas_euryale.AAC.8
MPCHAHLSSDHVPCHAHLSSGHMPCHAHLSSDHMPCHAHLSSEHETAALASSALQSTLTTAAECPVSVWRAWPEAASHRWSDLSAPAPTTCARQGRVGRV